MHLHYGGYCDKSGEWHDTTEVELEASDPPAEAIYALASQHGLPLLEDRLGRIVLDGFYQSESITRMVEAGDKPFVSEPYFLRLSSKADDVVVSEKYL